MILLTKSSGQRKVGINPDHLVCTDPRPDKEGGGSIVMLLSDVVFAVTETPQEIEDAISRHYTKYTSG